MEVRFSAGGYRREAHAAQGCSCLDFDAIAAPTRYKGQLASAT